MLQNKDKQENLKSFLHSLLPPRSSTPRHEMVCTCSLVVDVLILELGKTVLHCASIFGDVEAVIQLLSLESM